MRKNNKIILSAILLGTAALLLTGCDNGKNNKKEEPQPVEEKEKGNCKILECINKLEITDDLEKINTTIGFEGEQVASEEGTKKYKWELNTDENIEVTFNDSGKNTIRLNFKDEKIAKKKVDFSEFVDLKEQISNGTEVKYDKVKETFKSEGTLIEKNATANIYKWVNEEGGYLEVSFSIVNGRCTLASGKY